MIIQYGDTIYHITFNYESSILPRLSEKKKYLLVKKDGIKREKMEE